ncbi:MAG: transglycosylase domain-containing protein [bacterium]
MIKILWGFFLFYLSFILLISLSLIVFPLPIKTLERNYSTVHLASKGELLRITLSPSEKYRIKLKLSDISDYLKRGFLLYEDRFFYSHYGVNPFSLLRALVVNIKNRRYVLGGSTITMQIAKMMEPKPRILRSKAIEILRALQLERKYSKRELLEIYLNMIPMGGNIEGVGAASYLYFGKPAKSISLSEASLLIALPKSPTAFRPDLYPEKAKKERNKIIDCIGKRIEKNKEVIQRAKREDICRKRFINPYYIPNLIVRTENIGPNFIKTYTIDMALQRRLEELVKLYSSLANGGRLRDLKFFKGSLDRNKGFQLLSKEASFIIGEMLSKVERTDLPQSWEFSPSRGRIAFKTGTSFGLRDAWCIGDNPDYTIGVWFGNVNCKSSSALVGIKVAGPIVIETFNSLTRYKDSWFKMPDGVSKRKVCVVSGEPIGPYCKEAISDYYIPGISSNKPCSVTVMDKMGRFDTVMIDVKRK